MKKYIFFLTLLLLFWRAGESFSKEEDILQLIQLQYRSILSFAGRFEQISFQKNTEMRPKKGAGNVIYKRPGKMRWKYLEPEEQLLVTNGKTLWLFDPLLENVTVQSLEKIAGGTALSFMLGLGDLKYDFERRKITKSLLETRDGFIVELVPKKNTANLEFIQLKVHPETFNLKIILLMDKFGNYRTISLKSMEYNLELEDKLFEFEITKNMEVIEVGNR